MKDIMKIAIVEYLLDKIEIISGKVFENGIEIKDLKKYICNEFRAKGKIILAKDLNAIIDTLYNFSTTGLWYELPLVKKARELGAKELPLPFDLDKKQLMIINRMCFHPNDEKMFIATGVGGSGKSTFLNIIKQLFDNDYSSCSLSNLSNEFNVAEAVKHRLICSDELAKGELNLPIIKQLVSKQNMFVNPKNRTGYEVHTQSSLFYCCNAAPKIDATDTGVLRRIVFYERNTKIKNPDVTQKDRIYTEEELLAILRTSLTLEDDLWYNMFIEETHKYIMSTNNVFRFIGVNIYQEYKESCLIAGLKPFSEPNWEDIRTLFLQWLKEDNQHDQEVDIELPY